MAFIEKVIPVTRPTALPDFSGVDFSTISFREHPDLSGQTVFTCERLNAVLTADSCAKNYSREKALVSCAKCPIGLQHATGVTDHRKDNPHTALETSYGLACIRCERTDSKRTVGRFRLVRNHTLCINCFNRQREVELGRNGKNSTPVKWAHLRPATITIKVAGKCKTVDIGLRAGRPECERYVERIHPSAKLLKVTFDGKVIAPGTAAPVIEIGMNGKPLKSQQPKPTSTPRTPNSLPVASDREAFEDTYTPIKPREGGWRRLPAITPEQALAYERSFEDNEPIVERTTPVNDVEPICTDEPTTIESVEDELILDHWRSIEQLVAFITEGWPEPQPVEAVEPEAPRAPYLRLIGGHWIQTAEDIANFVGGKCVPSVTHWRGRPLSHWAKVMRKRVSTLRKRLIETGTLERPRDDSEFAAAHEPIASVVASETQSDPVAGTLSWRGRALADIAAERGEDLAAVESRMLATGSPFPAVRAAVRPPPAHSTSAVAFSGVAPTVAPVIEPEPAEQPIVQPRTQAPKPALGEPRRVFHPLLKRLGFQAGKLYGAVMPLSVEKYRGPMSRVLFGCLCSDTFHATAQSVLRGHTIDCGCGIKPEAPKPEHDFAAYLRTLRAMPPVRLCASTTYENSIAIGVRAYIRSARIVTLEKPASL
ncbi:hypothetical protein [Paraburkholderia sediminicola]|uniref:hypothetical protein n=1 Tax=Paraburkholderia sediminicola TaxID=458836 RepID=UPI0038BBF321